MKTSSTISAKPASGAPGLGRQPKRSVRACSQEDFLRLLGMPTLRSSDAASMAVVLKRDHGTQLTVNVKLDHGHYEVVASLDRDNPAAFSSDLARLRLRLAERGIALAPLASSNDFAAWYAAGDLSSTSRSAPLAAVTRPQPERFDMLTLLAAMDAQGTLN